MESNLRFLGLIVFENKLKPGTGSAIRTLLNAHIPCRMVTGDNIRTAVSVTRECGMINYHDHVYMPTFKTGDMMDSKAELEWTHVEDERLKLDSYSLKPAVPVSDTGSLMSFDMGERAYHLAVTGDVFRWMIDYGSSETLQRVREKSRSVLFGIRPRLALSSVTSSRLNSFSLSASSTRECRLTRSTRS